MPVSKPFQPMYVPNSGNAAGTLVSSLTISATSTSATSGALPGNVGLNELNQIQISNTVAVWAYVNFGRNTTEIPAATVAASYPVPPSTVIVVTVTSEVAAVSVILASSTGSVIFTRGTGV
jgi:hypothetical protein